MRNKLLSGMFWKLLERFGYQGTQFVLQLILARLLNPEIYGVLSMLMVFTTLANVFIQTGFSTSLVQNKEVTEDDYSSVFWVTLIVAAVLYAVIFAASPMIGRIYEMPEIVVPLRVLALMLFPGAVNSVQLAKVTREMDFRKVFISNIGGAIVSGLVGIVIALRGGGLWALVVQTMLNIVVACLVMCFTSKLRVRFVCKLKRVKELFSFGWKLLCSSLLGTLYQDISTLVIGLKYDSGTLGFYNRGKQFPQFLINAVNGTVESVMLPALAQKQDERNTLKDIMRSSVVMSAYVIFPVMAGLAGIAEPLVELLLTEKWLPCVPYLQIFCFSLAFYPVHSCNLQAINAVGRSDIFLKLELIKKAYGLLSLVIAVAFFNSPLAIAMTGVFTTLISCFVNASPNKKLIGYSYLEQMKDILPFAAMAVVMLLCVLAVGLLNLPTWILMLLQILTGVAVYAVISAAFKVKPFLQILSLCKKSK